MSHPKMFDDDDPMLARVREIALGLPDTAEKVSHGRPAFYTKKVFTYYGFSRKVDGQWVQHPQGIVFVPADDERAALLEDQRFAVPAYLGPSGWLGMDLTPSTDFTEVAELIEESYRLTAGVRRVKVLDALRADDEPG